MGHNNIREARKKAGLTQEQLAKIVGINRATLSRYESGNIDPPSSQLLHMADILGVSVGYLQGHEPIDLKELFSAVNTQDYRAMEQLMGLPEGSIIPIPIEDVLKADERMQEIRRDTEINLKKLNTVIRLTYTHFTEPDYLAIRNVITSLSHLNDDGLQKAMERVEELAEIPRYQRQDTFDRADTLAERAGYHRQIARSAQDASAIDTPPRPEPSSELMKNSE